MHKIFIISDTHFGHTELVNKGFRPKGYGEKICANLSLLRLDAGDIVYHLGDVAVAENSAAEAAANVMFTHMSAAKMVLIRGNHDSRSTGWYLDKGWSAVLDAAVLSVYGMNIYLSHEPVEFMPRFNVNIHGHLHDNGHREEEFPFLDTHFNLLYSCEKFHYQPVQLKTMLKGFAENRVVGL